MICGGADGIYAALRGRFPRWLGETLIREAHAGRYIMREEKARMFCSATGILYTVHLSEVAWRTQSDHTYGLRVVEILEKLA